jgi:DNA-binding CsgD family transcriptional regulator
VRADGAIAVVEAAYNLDLSDTEWLLAMARSACRVLGDPDMMAHAAIYRSNEDGFQFEARALEPHDDDYLSAIDAMESRLPTRINATKYRTTFCQSASELAVSYRLPASVASMVLGYALKRWNVREVVQIQGGVLEDLSVGISAARRQPVTISPRQRHTWKLVGTHMAAGLRLRRSVGSRARLIEDADLVFERSGAIASARNEVAIDRELREKLRESARAVEHARGALARDDTDKAVELWRGLFEGRWTVVETFDSDGRAYVVAHENEPMVAETRALTRRERQVVELAAQGHSDDFVAYTLGLSATTVQTHLQRALTKLGIATRVQLVRAAFTLRGRLNGKLKR